jgi:hypothetical protein
MEITFESIILDENSIKVIITYNKSCENYINKNISISNKVRDLAKYFGMTSAWVAVSNDYYLQLSYIFPHIEGVRYFKEILKEENYFLLNERIN